MKQSHFFILNAALLLIFNFVSLSNSWAQTDDEKEQLKNIRNHYYTFNNSIDSYLSHEINDTLKAFSKSGHIEKILVTKANGSVEYYFNPKGDLNFIFSNLDNKENRYYYIIGNSNQFNIQYPRMFRWIDSHGNQIPQDSAAFPPTGMTQSQNAVNAQYLCRITIDDSPQKKSNLKLINSIDTEVERIEFNAKIFETIDNSEQPNEEELENGEPFYVCQDLTENYSIGDSKMIVKSTNVSGCDGGCTVTSQSHITKYFNSEGKLILKIITGSSQYFGYPGIIYNYNFTNLFSSSLEYYNNEQLVFTKTESGANGFVMTID